jgi:hypothetical protein
LYVLIFTQFAAKRKGDRGRRKRRRRRRRRRNKLQ